MGKAQKKKAMRRHNPMRVPDSHLPKGLSAASSTSDKVEVIPPIIQKLESLDVSERKWACIAVSNVIQNDPSTRRLLQGKNIVGTLIKMLADSEEEVVVEAMGSLRNLCIDGGYDICAEMFNKDILTHLKMLITKISNTLSQPLDTLPKSSLIYSLSDNVITVLWCLSETSNKALNAINAMNLVPFLMSFILHKDNLPLVPVNAAAQCLYVLSDDNPPAVSEIRSNASHIACMISILKQERPENSMNTPIQINEQRVVTLHVLIAGILKNISPIPPPSPSSSLDIDKDVVLPLLHPTIASISLTNISDAAQQAIAQQSSESNEKAPLKNTPKSDHKEPTELELELLETKLRTAQLALEILTGTCAILPEVEVADTEAVNILGDNIEDDGDVLMDEEAMAIDVPGATIALPNGTTSMLPALVLPLVALCRPTALSFPPLAAPSIHPPITSALSAVHICALECLNNLFLGLSQIPNSSISDDKQSGLKVWNEIWSVLESVGTQFGPGQERRREVWENAIGVLWGVGKIWKGLFEPIEAQVNLLMQFYDSTADHKVKVMCLGTLECLAQYPNSMDGNRVIAEYLLSVLSSDAAPSKNTEIILQAASALIDIYSDEELPYDINFRQGHYLQKLSTAVDQVKKTVKAIDKQKPGGKALRLRGQEVYENLVAFIQYRKGLRL